MSTHRFTYKKYKNPSDRLICPACHHKGKFSPYIDTVTGEQLPIKYGKCERVNGCGYELNPHEDGYAQMIWDKERSEKRSVRKRKISKPLTMQRPTVLAPKPIIFIPDALKEASLKAYRGNTFVQYLHTLFEAPDVETVTARYQIGTSGHWQGATVFWYIDIQNCVRAGQIKHFDETGHTIKDLLSDSETKSRTTWVHSVLKYKQPWPDWLENYLEQDIKISCLFGEHLLKQEPDKVICLVEAPKTAIIASLYFPKFIWLATGSLNYLTPERCKALEGRKVILWPDLKAFTKWQEKARALGNVHCYVSDFLENLAPDEERQQGLDLADYLVNHHYIDFQLGYPREWN